MTADRELRAEITVDATPAEVWAALTDLDRMRDWSPELVRMIPLKRGGLREGQWYLGINRRKWVFWPTRSVVTAFDPGRVLAWDTRTSGVRWVFELAPDGNGTKILQRRPVPKRLTVMSNVFATLLLGGSESHADELEAGMHETLSRLKASIHQ